MQDDDEIINSVHNHNYIGYDIKLEYEILDINKIKYNVTFIPFIKECMYEARKDERERSNYKINELNNKITELLLKIEGLEIEIKELKRENRELGNEIREMNKIMVSE